MNTNFKSIDVFGYDIENNGSIGTLAIPGILNESEYGVYAILNCTIRYTILFITIYNIAVDTQVQTVTLSSH